VLPLVALPLVAGLRWIVERTLTWLTV